MPPIPKKAVTVILLREKKPEGFEVFLLKRHEKSSFMGGNYVYPGGRVERDDGSLETCSLCKGVTPEEASRTLAASLSPEESMAHWIAGIRELFEEAGILFAYTAAGNPIDFSGPADQEKFLHYRHALQKGEMTICQVAQEENILFALDQLYYHAHWITPEAHTYRFDTRFFIARHPEGQVASHDMKETIAGTWITPVQALDENLNGEIALSPPTVKTLEDLSRFRSIDEVFDSLKRNAIEPILPFLTTISGDTFILFPWDAEYKAFVRGEIPVSIDHGRPSGLSDTTTRVVLREGHWLPYCR
jgi:8-oxo-dGTP pyrophosphatase MutT (NUDIX family)